MARASFGGAEGAFNPEAWATAQQREMLTAALEAARRNGLRLDMTLGASWPVTTPNTKPGSGRAREVAWGAGITRPVIPRLRPPAGRLSLAAARPVRGDRLGELETTGRSRSGRCGSHSPTTGPAARTYWSRQAAHRRRGLPQRLRHDRRQLPPQRHRQAAAGRHGHARGPRHAAGDAVLRRGRRSSGAPTRVDLNRGSAPHAPQPSGR